MLLCIGVGSCIVRGGLLIPCMLDARGLLWPGVSLEQAGDILHAGPEGAAVAEAVTSPAVAQAMGLRQIQSLEVADDSV